MILHFHQMQTGRTIGTLRSLPARPGHRYISVSAIQKQSMLLDLSLLIPLKWAHVIDLSPSAKTPAHTALVR